MNQKKLKQIADYALVAAFPELMGKTLPCRATGKIAKAAKLATKEIENRPLLEPEEIEFCHQRVERFKEMTGWSRTERHILTYLSFLLALFDQKTDKNDKKMQSHLSEAALYYSEKPQYHLCFRAGAAAFEKWEALWGK